MMKDMLNSMRYSGLTVRNGRLINEQVGNAMAPITKAAMDRKNLKREMKTARMAEAFYRGEMMADIEKDMKKIR
jgi:hypothetical protein